VTSPSLLVSTIIPVFNGERFLPLAVESIRRQGCPSIEIIVVDDGSTDGTATVAREFGDPVRWVTQANAGPPAARNRGLDLARGDLIAFLDVDDLWSEDKLRVQVARLAAEPELDLVVGMTQLLCPTGLAEGEPAFEPQGAPGLLPSVGSALFRRRVFDRVGRFDETQRMDDDVDWFLRAFEQGVRMAVLPTVAQYYRRHDRNITNARATDMRYLLFAIKKSLDRRRTEPGAAARALTGWPAREAARDE